ncbi:MAG: TolC family protein [Calditrichaeota bacterium]|nr:MAG: TolC family protein [Calditrichota bacterium]
MKYVRYLLLIGCLVSGLYFTVDAAVLSLQDAIEIAVYKSNRGEIIEGDLEVARQQYQAERINFYVPDISINGSLPVYSVTENFDYLPGQTDKTQNKYTNMNFDADITLEQSLITGGEFTIRSRLFNREQEFPQVFRLQNDSTFISDVTQINKQGSVDFSFSQPLLKPSQPKNDLKNRRDDMHIAEYVNIEELANLKKEVVEAYFGVLQTELQLSVKKFTTESKLIQKNIDSAKFIDEIISEETWLTSASELIDAELEQFDKEIEHREKIRELAQVLDLEDGETVGTKMPVIANHISNGEKQRLINNYENSIPILKAQLEYDKAERQANFTASSHGLTGTLEANYSLVRGDIEVQDELSTNNTDSWGLSVNFTLPLWDGGAKGAEIKAAKLSSKKSKIEFEKTKKSARSEISSLVNKLDISYNKLQVITKQIELAQNKLDIAKYRMEDGQISRIEFLESEVYFLETQDKYLEELKTYFNTKFDIEGRYIS